MKLGKLKQFGNSPKTTATLLYFAVVLATHYFLTLSLEQRVEAYFGVTLLFVGWCFEQARKTPELTWEEKDKLGAQWAKEVDRAKRDLQEYARLVAPEKHWRDWSEAERKRLSDFNDRSYYMYLNKLALEFKTEDRRVALRRYWNYTDDNYQDVIPLSMDELLDKDGKK